MKGTLIITLLILIPVSTLAQPTLGVYFDPWPGKMHIEVECEHIYHAYLYGHNIDCMLTAVEYELDMPADLSVILTTYPPEYQIHMGSATTGHSITYWPPLNGWTPGYNILATYSILAQDCCTWHGGTLVDKPMVIIVHPKGGQVAGTCYPDNAIFDFIGLTSTICPEVISVEEQSWGAIKALYR